MESIASSPAIQAARFELTQARENMGRRLRSSQYLVQAFEHFDSNQVYFDKSREGIQQLIAKTDSLTKAISTLEAAGIDAGTTNIIVPGRFWGARQVVRSVVEVQDEIRSNLDQEVVKTGLRTLGIVKAPRFVFKMPEAPSGRTIAISSAVAGSAAALGAGIYFRDEIMGGISSAAQNLPDLSQYMTMPNMPDFSQYTPDFSQYKPDLSQYNFSQYIPTQDQAVEFLTNPITIGVGVAAGTLLAGAAIYKVVQSRKNQEAETVAKAPVEVAVEEPKTEEIA